MTRPLDRPEVLPGLSYKLKWPESDHAIYVTLNDVVREGPQTPLRNLHQLKEHGTTTPGPWRSRA